MLIKKIKKIDIRMDQLRMRFIMHMLTNVFFGCEIVKFSDKEIKELKKKHKITMIRKLGLGDKFPRNLLHV